jgi:hypothetical protein
VLNLVERWFAELTTKKLQRSSHPSVRRLKDDVTAWTAACNADPKPYTWVKTADEISNRSPLLPENFRHRTPGSPCWTKR